MLGEAWEDVEENLPLGLVPGRAVDHLFRDQAQAVSKSNSDSSPLSPLTWCAISMLSSPQIKGEERKT